MRGKTLQVALGLVPRGRNQDEGTKMNDLGTVELNLGRTIDEMKKAQQDSLKGLHEEIDHLKKQYQKLQFQITMKILPNQDKTLNLKSNRIHGNSSSAKEAISNKFLDSQKNKTPVTRQNSPLDSKAEPPMDLKVAKCVAEANAFTDPTLASQNREIEQLKKALKEERQLHCQLLETLKKATSDKVDKECHDDLNEDLDKEILHQPSGSNSNVLHLKDFCPLPFDATIEPFLVHTSFNSEGPRPPTISECEIIIKTLTERVSKQSKELSNIKTDMNDVLSSRSLTPESYLLAKYYSQDTSDCRVSTKCTCNARKTATDGITSVVSILDSASLPPLQTSRFKMEKKPLRFPFRHPFCEGKLHDQHQDR